MASSVRKSSLRFLVVAILALLAVSAVVVATPSLRWRAQLVGLYATGRIPDFDRGDLVGVLLPGSPQQSARLVDSRNPYAVMQNPRTSATSVEAGSRAYQANCAICHGDDRNGTSGGPSLVDDTWKHGDSDWALFRSIRHGIPAMGMPPHSLPDADVWDLVAFIRSDGSDGPATDDVDGLKQTLARLSVPYQEIASVSAAGADWLTYAGAYSSIRHSTLSEISPQNVAQLALRWVHQVPGDPGEIQASPVVRDGIMYLTAPANVVLALDAGTGRELWRYYRPPPDNLRAGEFGVRANRGVAVLDNRVFVATGDARLVALSAGTGKQLWEAVVDDKVTHKITSAPLVYRDLVVIGTGTQAGGRGAIVAYGAADGVERWRFHSVPRPGEAGHDTWEDGSWQTGGASPWLTGSYDVANDLLIWGVGNPKPDYDAASRDGANLYSNSVVALRGTTGELVWYFQFTPGDDHDWDSAQSPILVDLPDAGERQPRILWANRNGFYYVLDRLTGRFVTARPFVHQNWADGVDEAGRPPIRRQAGAATRGVLTYPSNTGGTNWWSPSYDPELNLIFVPVLERGMIFFKAANSWPRATARPLQTGVRALEAATGRMVWEYMHSPRRDVSETGGTLSTRSGLVFGGDQSTFFALASKTGHLLWSVEAGGRIEGAPVSYALDNEQFVAISAGGNVMGFALPRLRASPDVTTAGLP